MANPLGYKLPADWFVQESQVFPDFPGVFFPGDPVTLVQMTEADADDVIEEANLPLEKVEAVP